MSIALRSCVVGLLVVFASFGVGGCKKKVAEAETVPSASAPEASYSAGDKVDVNWNGAWWKGEVLATDGAKFKIHYVGWGANWDESVPAARLRAQTADSKVGSESTAAAGVVSAAPTAVPADTAKVATTRLFKVGDKVDVNWKGAWYQGQVIGTPGSQFRVHYIGFGANWDENVPSSRLKAFSGTAKKGSGA